MRGEGIYRDALVIIAADHGEELFDHGGFGHAYTLHREVLHVPLFIELPRQSKGRLIRSYASLMDIHPTVLDLLGLKPTPQLHGRSLVSLLSAEELEVAKGKTEEGESRSLYFQEQSKRMRGRALLTGEYKLIQIERDYLHPLPVSQLFDIRLDPLEMHDLASERPDVVAELSRRLEARLAEYRRSTRVDAENLREQLNEEALRALGYVE